MTNLFISKKTYNILYSFLNFRIIIIEIIIKKIGFQHSAGVGQLAAAQVDLVVHHHPDKLLLPARDEARAQHMVHAEGLGRRGGRRSRVVRCLIKLLAQPQIVQDQPVAVVGNAQTVCDLGIGGGGKIEADPGGQPGARVSALGHKRPFSVPSPASTQ